MYKYMYVCIYIRIHTYMHCVICRPIIRGSESYIYVKCLFLDIYILMYVYIYKYVYMHIYICISMYICIYIRIHTYMHCVIRRPIIRGGESYIHVKCLFLDIYILMYISINMYICTCIYVYTYVYIRTCTV